MRRLPARAHRAHQPRRGGGQLTLSLAFASDFADIFEVRGIRRKRRGQAWSRMLGAGGVVLSYRGLDASVRETALSFEPAPTLQMESVATYALKLAPGAQAHDLRHRLQPRPAAAIDHSRSSRASSPCIASAGRRRATWRPSRPPTAS